MSSDHESGGESPQHHVPPPQRPRGGRRAAVSSEPVSKEAMDNWTAPQYPKSEADRHFLREVINTKLGLLFGHLGSEAKDAVIAAMQRREVPAGTTLIRQGDMAGDFFYIVDEGTVEIFVAREGKPEEKVMVAGRGASFGELALLYNAPRAATCTAAEAGVVWALDRESFKMMLVTSENTKRRRYEKFLEDVHIFQALNRYERCQLSDILTAETCKDGTRIITQGETGDRFYIVEDGEAVAMMSEGGKPEIEVARYRRGGFFGELALISDAPRKASVVAAGTTKLLWIDKPTFDRVLGPIIDLLRANADKYPSYHDFLSKAATA